MRQSFSVWLLTGFMAVFMIFAWQLEIDQTVRTQGQIISLARTQVVQVADGGILASLLVHEGDLVDANQTLAFLAKDRSTASLGELQAKLMGLRVALIRLNAEASQIALTYSPELYRDWPQLVSAQMQLFTQRRDALNVELKALDQAVKLAEQERDVNSKLLASGDIAEIDFMRAERQVIDLNIRRQGLYNKFRSDVRADIARIEEDYAALRFKFDERQDILKQTKLVSPMRGIVKQVRVTTVGGVLRPGEELMQISPIDSDLVVEIRINPVDIGLLNTGLPANLRFDAFDSALYGSLTGELTYLSPDTFSEQGQGGIQTVYYKGKLRIRWTDESDVRIKPSDLQAGMTVSADIRTGSRSLLAYLFSPIHKAFRGALREK